MPAYTAALQARYPPVCKDCQPSIDEELKEKEHMARTTALGGWLKRSQHVGARRSEEQQRVKPLVTFWRLRGLLWAVTTFMFAAIDLASMQRPAVLHLDTHDFCRDISVQSGACVACYSFTSACVLILVMDILGSYLVFYLAPPPTGTKFRRCWSQ